MEIKYYLLFLILLVEIILLIDFRSRRITGEYLITASVLSFLAFFFSINTNLLEIIAHSLGFIIPSNLILFTLASLGLLLTYRLNKQIKTIQDKLNILAQTVALNETKDIDEN